MAKPHKEGSGWAIRIRYKGEELYLHGYPTAAAATRAGEAEKQSVDKIGRPSRLAACRT